MTYYLAISTEAATIAVVFASVRPDVFEYWYDLLLWMEAKGGFWKWISKPIGLCHMCVAGQIGFWWSFYASGWHLSAMPHVLFSASAAILLAALLNKFHEWTKK